MSSLVAILDIVPRIALGVPAGVVSDRYNKRTLLVLTGSIRLLVVAGLAAAPVGLWMVFTATPLLAVTDTLYRPSLYAIIPELVENTRLIRTNSVVETMSKSALILGAGLGGTVAGLLGARQALGCNAFIFIVAALAAAMLPQAVQRQAAERPPGILSQVRQGVSVLRTVPGLLGIVILAVAVNPFLQPVAVLLPGFVDDVLCAGPSIYGLLEGTFSAGFLVGAIALGLIGRTPETRVAILVSLAVSGLAVLGLSLSHGVAAAWTALFVCGVAISVGNILITSLIQERVTAGQCGLVFGLVTALSGCATPISFAVVGPLADILGPAAVWTGCGTCIIALTAAVLLFGRQTLWPKVSQPSTQ